MYRRTIITLLAATLTGCGSTALTTGAVAGATGIASGLLSPSEVDPDYSAYLEACKAEYAAQQQASSVTEAAMVTALGETTDAQTRGSLIILTALKTLRPQTFKCSIDRKKGFVENIGSNGLIGAAIEVYKINRDNKNFNKQLEANSRQFELQLQADTDARRDMNGFWSGLIGNYNDRKPDTATTPTPTTTNTAP
jgi:hypothetical protein